MKKISFKNLAGLNTRQEGLADQEVKSQTSRFGRNDIVEVSGSPWHELARDTLKDPMIWLLLVIGGIFIWVGESSEALVLFVAILPLVFMDAILHWRTNASTSGLKSQLASQATVIRNSTKISINSADLVPGDLLTITPDTFLPADGIFESATDVQIDESALSGESFPIKKDGAEIDPFSLSDSPEVSISAAALGFAGTRVLTGHGTFRVLFTGRQTAYGEIVHSVSTLTHERTPLQKSITKLVQYLVLFAAILCLVLAAVRVYQGHGWLDALLSAATLAVAAIPEEFPVVFTFFLGVGVFRLAKRKALVRRAVSVENIGRVSYICTDKTGTITIGKLELTHFDAVPGESENTLLLASLSASNSNGSDPVDVAITESSKERGLTQPTVLQTFPFTEDRKRQTAIVELAGGTKCAFAKGSPETILAISNLNEDEKQTWLENTRKWAREGHKVLACAKKVMPNDSKEQQKEPDNCFEFCGLIVFEDPARPEVAEAITYCRKNNIGILMITGDHPDTASAIARDIGLGGNRPIAISAEAEPEKFTEHWLHSHPQFLREINIVSRCTPLQKLRIVEALKKHGELVAVTGDGVNDVPALKAADIGIAMGERGTRSAKEVASIVLSDDNFQTIVNAIMEGRQLFANLRISFQYLLLIHFPLVVTAALIPLLGYPILYLPVHIVWLELIIHPTALFAFQLVARDQDKVELPRSYFFSKSESILIVLIGLGVSLAIGIAFVSGLSETDIGHARSFALAILALWSASLVFVFSKFRVRSAVMMAVATVLSALLLIQVKALAKWLHLTPLHFIDWCYATGIVLSFALILKLFSSTTNRLTKN